MDHDKQPYVPEPAIGRLPWYLACISEMRAEGVEYVSSTAISHQLNVDASQIAKDLSYLNIKGKTRIGYDVRQLEEGLSDFLGFHRRHNAVMMGVGSLGRALITDSGLQRYGLNIVAGIDTNPALALTSINGVRIYPPHRLKELVRELGIQIGIIAVPIEFAQAVSDSICEAGIRAIWNFTPSRIRVPEGVVVTNTSIYSHLALIYNRLSSLNPSES